MVESNVAANNPLRRLHIGGKQVQEGWEILNIQSGKGVDFVGDVADLSRFQDDVFDEIYASHVLEHLGYINALPAALTGIHQKLKPGGIFRMSVPDLETLCRLFLDNGMDDK